MGWTVRLINMAACSDFAGWIIKPRSRNGLHHNLAAVLDYIEPCPAIAFIDGTGNGPLVSIDHDFLHHSILTGCTSKRVGTVSKSPLDAGEILKGGQDFVTLLIDGPGRFPVSGLIETVLGCSMILLRGYDPFRSMFICEPVLSI